MSVIAVLLQPTTRLSKDKQYIFNINIDELLTQPVPTIKTWVHKATLRIKSYKNRQKAKKKQQQLKTVHIHPFFTQQLLHKPQQTKTRPKQKVNKYMSTTLSKFFPKLRRPEPPPSQNDLFPP
jgi:hypothetical protein